MIPRQELQLQLLEKAVSSLPQPIVESRQKGPDCYLHLTVASWILMILR
jgi:hypothetical protein